MLSSRSNHPRVPAAFVAIAVCCVDASAARAQGAEPHEWRVTERMIATVGNDDYGSIDRVMELGRDVALVLDRSEMTVWRVDAATGRRTSLARRGSGPLELQVPTVLLRWMAGGAIVFDPGNQRLLVIDSLGSPTGTLREPPRPPGAPPFSFHRGTDAAGRLYSASPQFESPSRDQLTLFRSRPGSDDRPDVLGAIPALDMIPKRAGSIAFDPTGGPAGRVVEWAVLTDGSLIAVHPDPFQVRIRTPVGAWSTGPVLPYEPIVVTSAVKREWEEAEALRGARRVRALDPTRGGSPPPAGMFAREAPDWPAQLPPFVVNAVLEAGDEVWIRRTESPESTSAVYLRIDRHGTLIGSVRVPRSTRVVGVARRTVYLAVRDKDGIETLGRVSRP